MMTKVVRIGNISISNRLPIVLIAGPCMMESRDVVLRCAEYLATMCGELDLSLIFKTSFDKANRTSLDAQRGLPLNEALKVFEELRSTFRFPIITDVHESAQVPVIAEYVDVLQIPAYLCRQTDLLLAAAKSGKAVNIKKGQFLAPWDMKNVLEKVTKSGNDDVLLCERGTCFGYNRLVSDMRSLQIMEKFGYPVIFDATHSVQEPGGLGGSSGGNRDYVELLARSAVSVGVAGLFIETHFDPKNAYSDGPNMVPLHVMKGFVETMMRFDALAKQTPYQDMSC